MGKLDKMKWFLLFCLMIGLGIVFTPNETKAAAYTKVSVPWENGRLVEGQIGKVNLKDSNTNATLQYRVYSYKVENGKTYYGVGGGEFIMQKPGVVYKTPSKQKLRQVNNLSYIRPNLLTLAKQGVLKGQPFKLNTVNLDYIQKYYNKKPDRVTKDSQTYYEYVYHNFRYRVNMINWINPNTTSYTVQQVKGILGKPTVDFNSRLRSPVLLYERGAYLLAIHFDGDKKYSKVMKVDLGPTGTDIYYKETK